MFSQASSGNPTLKIVIGVFSGVLIIGVVGGLLSRKSGGHQTGFSSSDRIKADAPPQPIESGVAPRQAAKAPDASPPIEAWATKDSRDILGAFFIKPYLRQWLKDPDSLQDFAVVNARPNKKLKDSYNVTVFYRARNSFGALVPEQRTVVMIYNPSDDNHPWVLMP